MRKEILQQLEKMGETFPLRRGERVPYEEVEAAFKIIGFVLPPSYKEFIHLYGGIHVGAYPIYGLRCSPAMGRGEESALIVTERYKKEGWFSKKWFNMEKALVISTDHGGNPYALDEMGKIWLLDHDYGSKELIAEDFEDFLENWCLKDMDKND